jgi:UTP--glucose-1-phosphate uridylyltransferase
MRVTKCVITAAGPRQRALPLQTLVARDGSPKTVLSLLVEEAVRARVEQICVVVAPGDEPSYAQAAGPAAARLQFIVQQEPRGYAAALACAAGFTGPDPFLHLVSDHLCVEAGERGCAQSLVDVAEREGCSVSAVQATREHLLTRFGCVGGRPVAHHAGLYEVDKVAEKPTPTEAEQRLVVPGLRSGHYLCFFGMHVLTPAVMTLLSGLPDGSTLSTALERLGRTERYLALEMPDRRYDLGERYGLLSAQLALAMAGKDRDEVLSLLVEMLAR